MQKPPPYPQEQDRLEALARLAILDTGPEDSYDRLVLLASQVCDAPIALISLVDAHRLWFKSRVGLDVCEVSRDDGFCSFAIHTPDDVMLVPDMQLDPRFADHPLVAGPPHIRFYAGAPLVVDGLPVGTLCVSDMQPRTLEAWQVQSLRLLAKRVVRLIENKAPADGGHDV
jgi:GAF domain-containing protein